MLELAILDTNSLVVENETVTVDVRIANRGEVDATPDIELRIVDAVVDSRPRLVSAGQVLTVSLKWTTEPGDVGNYRSTVVVWSSHVSTNIVVEGNEPPVVSLVAPSEVTVGDSISISADAVDPDGEIASYEWQIDGELVDTRAELDHSFEEPGEYEIEVSVTDERGTTTSLTMTVQVAADMRSTPTPTPDEQPGFGFLVAFGALGLPIALLSPRPMK